MILHRRIIQSLILSIILGTAFYAVAVLSTDMKSVWSAVVRIGLMGWAIILALSMLNYGLRFLRWHLYLGHIGATVPVHRNLAYYLAGFALTTTPGKAGETVRSLYLRRYMVEYSHSLAAFFAERFIDTVAIILLSLAAALNFVDMRWPVILIAGLISVLLPLIHSQLLRRMLERLRSSFNVQRIKAFFGHLLSMVQSSSELLKYGSLYTGLIIGLLAWGAEGVGLFVILDYLEVHTSITLAIGIYAVSVLVGAISFIPGGIGGTEAAMVMLLGLIGVDLSVAVAATLVCRVATLWFAVVIGLMTMAGLELSADRLSNRQTVGIRR